MFTYSKDVFDSGYGDYFVVHMISKVAVDCYRNKEDAHLRADHRNRVARELGLLAIYKVLERKDGIPC